MSEWFSQAYFDTIFGAAVGVSEHGLEARRVAFAQFLALGGLPTTRNEEWKYTSTRTLSEIPFKMPGAFAKGDEQGMELSCWLRSERAEHAARLVFINGQYVEHLSSVGELPEGVQVTAFSQSEDVAQAVLNHGSQAVADLKHPFAALNAAYAVDGVYIRVRQGVTLEKPIHLLFLSHATEHPTVYFPRVEVDIEANADVRVIETYAATREHVEHPTLTCALTRVRLAQGGRCEILKHQSESPQAFHVALTQAQLARDSHWTHQNFVLGARWSRDDIRASLEGEGAEAHLDGLYLTRDQHLDIHTVIDHCVPNCQSNELYKGVLDGRGEGVFNGKIFVRPDAQKTAAFQSNRNLLLSPDATINTKPQLEIWADDVRCTHGCTIGQLETAPLFYMQSRGIPEVQSRALLTYAFAGEVIERVKDNALRAQFTKHLATWMGAEFQD
jgi:Fe-S cluster assembly protein SufD